MKRKMTKLLAAVLCVLLVTALAVYAAANDTVQPTVVYLDGVSGNDANDGSAAGKAVKTLEKAYELLAAVEGGVGTNADAEGVVVLCGTVDHTTNFNLPKSGKGTVTHAGMITITSKWGDEDYQASAELKSTKSDGQYWQAGGPTTLQNIKLNAASTHFRIYGGNDFTIGEGVSIANSARFALCGGYCRIVTTDPVSLTVLSGEMDTVTPVPWGAGHGHSTGNNTIYVGGNAVVNTVLAGPVVNKNTPQTIASTVVTVAGDAVVKTFNNAGAGTVASSTLVLAGGTVQDAIQSANIQKTYLQVSGLSGEFTIPTKPKYESMTVTGNSDITLSVTMPEGIALIVEKGSKVTLAEGDAHTYTGEGEVVYVHEHNWVLDSENSTTGSCTHPGTNVYYCDLGSCTETKTESAGFVHNFVDGACSDCGGKHGTVYVRDGGTGDGYTASTAVGSLEDAYKALRERTDIVSNAEAKGTIIFCGRLSVNDHFNYSHDYSHAGTITYTGKGYDGVLEIYAATKESLSQYSDNYNGEHRFQLGGPTVMEDLTIDRGSASAGVSLTIYTGTSLVMAETVEVINTNWAGTYVEPVVGLTDQQIATMKLSAHRGYQPMGPENSILSFTAAGELGFDYIETDVYMTSDGQLICIHDSTLDRTTNGSGNVMNMTYEQILQYRIDTAGYGFDIKTAKPEDLYVPTFREYLEICKEYGCIPFIEIKDGREATLKAIVKMALEYFDAKDIVMSGGSLSHLKTSHEINQDLFIHLIWGDTSDAGYTNSINVLSQMKNSDGEIYAGIAFNITNLHIKENFDRAKGWIEKANAAGLQTCLRGADNMTQVRKMFELGIDYYPTNTTSPEKLQQLKQSTEGGYSFGSTSGGKLFIRGGNRGQEIADDISITLLGGLYDFVAPSNAEGICTGSYSVTVGGNAFVSRLIAGETNSNATGDRAASVVTVQDEATVKNLYLAGDVANTKSVTVNLLGGTVEAMNENRGKPGTAGDLTVNVASLDLLPGTYTISNSSLITGTKVLTIGSTGELGNAAAWNKLIAKDGAVVTLTGTYPEALEREGSGKFLVHDQSVSFSGTGSIVEDGAAVELGDLSCSIVGSGNVTLNWYADQEGEKGEKLSTAPVEAGTYWIGVSVAEVQDSKEALYHAAVEEQAVRFSIVHDLKLVPRLEPQVGVYGNIEHYLCKVCGMHFDAEGKVLTERDVMLDPLPEPSVPETTEAPEVTTEAPEATTEAPEATTEVPEATTDASEVTTEAPEATTEAPEAPEDTTEAPEATTEAPETTTEAPEATTEAPEVTTEAPEATTEVPEATTEAPEATTEAPEATTEAPEATTEAPESTVAPETSKPAESKPEESKPEETTKPEVTEITIKVTVPEGWENPGIWAWDNSGKNAFDAWPGLPLTKGDDGFWYATIPAWVENIIINANGGSVQTKYLALAQTKVDVDVTVTQAADGTVQAELNYSSPDTGDTTALTAMAAVMLLAAAGFVTTVSKKRF